MISQDEETTEIEKAGDTGEEAESAIELAITDDPINRLTPQQVNAATRLIMFPNASMQSVADSVGVSRQTIYNWKKDPDFQSFLATRQNSMVEKTISVRATRNAHVFDKMTDELYKRLEEPETDENKLREILGDNYTQAQLNQYQNRFASALGVKDVINLWIQMQGEVRKDEEQLGRGEAEESLFHKIQVAYENHLEMRRRQRDFESATGFTYDVDFNEQDATSIYADRAQAEVINVGGTDEDEEYEDAEFVEAEEDLLAMFTVE
jgi:AcrR family transcriptional regulator